MSEKSPNQRLTGRQIIYDEDGKPVLIFVVLLTFKWLLITTVSDRCRSCNTLEDFKFTTNKIPGFGITTRKAIATRKPSQISEDSKVPGCRSYEKVNPPDVNELGKASWNFLHTMTAQYPKTPDETQKKDMNQFLSLFSRVYPCNWCAKDFEKYIRENAPKVGSREELGRWMCEAHNSVNVKLRKEKFNCDFWEQRWKNGWDDQ